MGLIYYRKAHRSGTALIKDREAMKDEDGKPNGEYREVGASMKAFDSGKMRDYKDEDYVLKNNQFVYDDKGYKSQLKIETEEKKKKEEINKKRNEDAKKSAKKA